MMQIAAPRSWRLEFEQAARDRRDDIAYKDKMRRAQEIERDGRKLEEKKEQEREDIIAAGLALAPPEQVAAFRADLDTYDTATVEALMDNQEAAERNRKRIDQMLEQAAVLPDGRRVFKTRDGQRVFDQNGKELSHDDIDPASIDNAKPKWETYAGYKDEDARLMKERAALNAYQTKLDDARDRLHKGEITKADLKKLEGELKADMPEAVRAKVGLETTEPAPARKRDAEAVPQPNALDGMLRQSGLGPAPGSTSLSDNRMRDRNGPSL